MTPAEILIAVRAARAVMDLAVTAVKSLEQAGGLTPEQKAEIMREAGISDARLDAELEEAKQRLANQS